MIMILQLLSSIAIVYATGGDTGGTPFNASIVKAPSTRSSEGSAPSPSFAEGGDINSYMDCGGAPQCGVLVLETGFGAGYYSHAAPVVHGLWPETGGYGSSKCVPPSDPAPPQRVYPCYATNQDESAARQLSFEQHEWKAHGLCAGAQDAEDFFGQVCDLSSGPLAAMALLRSDGERKLSAFVSKLTESGYHVFYQDSYHSQVQLSACAGNDGRWILAEPAEFDEKCGGGGAESGLKQRGTGSRQTTPTPTAEPMVAPEPEADLMAKRVGTTREVPPMIHFFMELARVRLGDKTCFEGLVSKLSKTSCAALSSRKVPCARDHVQPDFLTITEDVCRYMGDSFFVKMMHNHWFPNLSSLDVGVSDPDTFFDHHNWF